MQKFLKRNSWLNDNKKSQSDRLNSYDFKKTMIYKYN